MIDYALLPVARLHPWPHNPRRTFNDGELAELAASIAQVGVIEPLVVRQLPTAVDPDEYEVIAGERRLRAAQLAGVQRVPVRIVELTDPDALELALTENSQRVHVDPLEEAHAVRRLVVHHGRPAGAVAARLGRTVAWVRARVRLAEAPEEVLGLYRAGLISARSADAILSCAADVQALTVQYLTAGRMGHWGYTQVLRVIEDRTRRLSTAPWALTDATLPGGACAGCPKRSGAQLDMWSAAEDRCLDPTCWAARDKVWWPRRRAEVEEAGGTVIAHDQPWGGEHLLRLDEEALPEVAAAAGLVAAEDEPQPTWRQVLERTAVAVPVSIERRPNYSGSDRMVTTEGVRHEDLLDALERGGQVDMAAALNPAQRVDPGTAAREAERVAKVAAQDAEREATKARYRTLWDALDDGRRWALVAAHMASPRLARDSADHRGLVGTYMARQAQWSPDLGALLEALAAEAAPAAAPDRGRDEYSACSMAE